MVLRPINDVVGECMECGTPFRHCNLVNLLCRQCLERQRCGKNRVKDDAAWVSTWLEKLTRLAQSRDITPTPTARGS